MSLANNGLELVAGQTEVFRVFFVFEIHWLRLAVSTCVVQSRLQINPTYMQNIRPLKIADTVNKSAFLSARSSEDYNY